MFFCNLKEAKLTPLENYTPADKEEKLSVAAVSKHKLTAEYSSNSIGQQYFRCGEFVFQVHHEGVNTVSMWKVPPGCLVVGAEGTLLIGDISLDCFKHLLYLSNKSKTSNKHTSQLEGIFKEYGVEYRDESTSELELIKAKVEEITMKIFNEHYANQYPYNCGTRFDLAESILGQLSQIENMLSLPE